MIKMRRSKNRHLLTRIKVYYTKQKKKIYRSIISCLEIVTVEPEMERSKSNLN